MNLIREQWAARNQGRGQPRDSRALAVTRQLRSYGQVPSLLADDAEGHAALTGLSATGDVSCVMSALRRPFFNLIRKLSQCACKHLSEKPHLVASVRCFDTRNDKRRRLADVQIQVPRGKYV